MIATDGRMTVTRPRLVRPAVMAASALMVVAGCSSGPEQGLLTAVRNADGVVMWEHDIEPNPTQVLVDGTVVIVAGVHDCDGNGRLVAVDASTGGERWSKPFEGGFSESAVTDGMVITAAKGGVVARRSADGTQRWTADRFGDAQLQVAAAADTVIVGVNDPGSEPRDAPRVVAIDSTTGQTRWVISLDGLGQILDVAVASDLAVVRASGTSMDERGTDRDRRCVVVERSHLVAPRTRDLGGVEAAPRVGRHRRRRPVDLRVVRANGCWHHRGACTVGGGRRPRRGHW